MILSENETRAFLEDGTASGIYYPEKAVSSGQHRRPAIIRAVYLG